MKECHYEDTEKCEVEYKDQCEVTYAYGKQCTKVPVPNCSTVKVALCSILEYRSPHQMLKYFVFRRRNVRKCHLRSARRFITTSAKSCPKKSEKRS